MEKAPYKNLGWYMVPFSIDDNKKWKTELRERIAKDDYYVSDNKNDEKNPEGWRRPHMGNCIRLFSHITDIFRENTDYSGVYNINDKLLERLEFPEKRTFKLKYGENAPADRVITRYNASCEGAFVIYYNNIGFLILEINYNDMSMEDINNFTYRFKRMGDSRKEFEENKPLPHTDKQGFLLGNIWEIVNGIINTDIVKPFFQITNHFNSECNIMQFINAEDEVTDEVALHIGRGYNADFVENKSSVNNSAVDMNFEPYDYINWRGCQSVLACITSQKRIESNSSGTEKFMRDYFPNAIKNDYLYMYLMLLFQRYTLLYYIDRVIKSHNDCNMLEKIYNEVLTFKQCLSFNIVSNEFTYQNIYNEMIKVLNINELFADINDLSEKVMSQTEKRQRSSIEILSTCFMILGVVDIIPLLVAVIDEPSGANVTGFCITAALVVSIIIYYIREKRKSKG